VTFRQRLALAVRLTVSYAAGLLVVGLLTGRGMFSVVGVLLSWPLYLVSLTVTIAFARSILEHPVSGPWLPFCSRAQFARSPCPSIGTSSRWRLSVFSAPPPPASCFTA
jgi:hypothetical protein